MKKLIPVILFFIITSFNLIEEGTSVVRIHQLSDPDMLNPINYTDASAGYIMANMFPSLLSIDFKMLNLVPVLAENRPTMEKTSDGKLKINYIIRKEAVWDNGEPITAKDVEFTLKVIKNPKVNNENNKPFYEFIEDIQIDKKNPKKFSLLCNSIYILAESSSGDYGILPEYLYDPKHLMSEFKIPQLNKDAHTLSSNEKIIEFADDFNSEKRMRDPNFIGGGGAYKFTEWKTGEYIVLEKKKNWWGNKLVKENCFFEAFPKKLIYKTYYDQASAIAAVKNGSIDVLYGIKPIDFIELQKLEKAKESFNLYTPPSLQYAYIGINTKLPKFADKKTRQALAYLVDVKSMIHSITKDLAEPTIGFIHPSDTLNYNSKLVPYTFDTTKAKQLLNEDGWKDTDGDGIIDKMIDGEKVEFNIAFTINAGNDIRRSTALMFQEAARKVGIIVSINLQDWSVYLDNLKNHHFDLYFGSWISTPVPDDPKQIYHSESTYGGSNYTGYGTLESDALIDSIRVELDEKKRAILYKRLQAMLHDEVPYIYLWAPVEKMVISKKFTNTYVSMMRPGFWPASFK